MKQSKCPFCKEKYTKLNSLQACCTSYPCIKKLMISRADKKARKELLTGRIAQKSLTDWLGDTQKAFNAYIRARDRDKPCISSGRPLTGKFDAGHFRTVKAASSIRFDPDNCHGQTVHDNQHLSGNVLEYRKRLIERIGVERVEALENNNATRRYSIDECKLIIAEYKQKLKDITA